MRSYVQSEQVTFYSDIPYTQKDSYIYKWIVDGELKGNEWKFVYSWDRIGVKNIKLEVTAKSNNVKSTTTINIFVRNLPSFKDNGIYSPPS